MFLDSYRKQMDTFYFKTIKLVLLSTLVLTCCCCHADPNIFTGQSCSVAVNSTAANSYQTNLNNLLNTLAEEGPLHNGFYKTTSGKKSDKIYSLIQCRGDVSSQACVNCTKKSITIALSDCPKSKRVALWFRWCFLCYSDEEFFGVWDKSLAAVSFESGVDDREVVLKGINLMNELGSMAPNQPLMFQTAIVDVGKRGKRYGLAECNRDMSKSDCAKCLNAQVEFFRTTIGNKTGSDVFGRSCRMLYNNYQFYFNFSTTATNGAKKPSSTQGGAAMGITISTMALSLQRHSCRTCP